MKNVIHCIIKQSFSLVSVRAHLCGLDFFFIYIYIYSWIPSHLNWAEPGWDQPSRCSHPVLTLGNLLRKDKLDVHTNSEFSQTFIPRLTVSFSHHSPSTVRGSSRWTRREPEELYLYFFQYLHWTEEGGSRLIFLKRFIFPNLVLSII